MLGAATILTVQEGENPILVDRPPLPTDASLVSTDLTGSADYTIGVYDLTSTTPTLDLLAEASADGTDDAATAGTSNVDGTEPLIASAVKAPTATYGGIWSKQGGDGTGYVLLYELLQSELFSDQPTNTVAAPMEGGHLYKVEIKLVTSTYGDRYAIWYVYVEPTVGT